MKICPQCQNTYTDDTLQFCLQDGTPLNFTNLSAQTPTASWNDEAQTVVRGENPPVRIDLTESQKKATNDYSVTSPELDTPKPARRSMGWLFAVLGLLFLVVLGGLVAAGIWFYTNSRSNNVVQNNRNSNVVNNPFNSVNNNASENSTPSPTATPSVTPTPKPTLKPAEIETAKKEAENLLSNWKSSAEDHNLDTNLSSYADTVDYYKGGKVNKAKLKASKEPAYNKYDSISINVSNTKVAVDPTGEKATVTFDKEWDFSGVDDGGNDVFNNGKVQQQLILNKVNGKWKIVSEKDLKVYFTDKSSGDDNN